MRTMQWAAGLVVATCLVLAPRPALAFSDPTTFSKLPLAAGGGGRFFTGSPADGYTCKVCHSGGAEPKLSVTGLPLKGYRPGTRYELMVSWPSTFDKMSLALELTNDAGKRVGGLQLPPDDEVQAPEYCEPATDGILAASLTETSERQVINVPECGSKRVRFLWTAPTTDVGRVWFSGAAVSSDGESDTAHDGVTDFGRVLGTPATASSTTAQCSAAQPGRDRGRGFGMSIAFAMLVLWAARLRRRARP